MGASWSSAVAQWVMTGAVREAGLGVESFLHADNGFPPPDKPAISVATDDVILFERGSAAEMQQHATAPVFNELDRVWRKYGIVAKDSKVMNWVPEATALGVDIVDGKFLMPKRARLLDVVSALIYLLTEGIASTQEFGHFFGVLQWLLLMNRPLLAYCGAVYRFVDCEDERPQTIPRKVLTELATIGCLLSSLVIDLRAGWTPFITASDGAESYGYG